MHRFPAFLIAATALTSPAWAASDPSKMPGSNDTRIRTVDYSTTSVTRITSTNMIPVTIVYGESETPKMISGLKVVNVTVDPSVKDAKARADAKAAADASCTDWCADYHANEITLQPLKEDNGSMLIITTERPDPSGTVTDPAHPPVLRHHYAYELHTELGQMTGEKKDGKELVPGDNAYFRVSYTYSAEDKARAIADWKAANAEKIAETARLAQKAKIDDKLKMAQFGGARNYKWTRGDSAACDELAAFSVSDNGQFTNVVFRPQQPVSIPNKYEGKDKESALNWHPEKAPDSSDIVVIESVPQQFTLNRNDKTCLYVRDPNAPMPVIPFTGTSAPDVVRVTHK